MDELFEHASTVNELLSRYGVKFGIYKNGQFNEQLFPFDPIPRIIKKAEFEQLEKGLILYNLLVAVNICKEQI